MKVFFVNPPFKGAAEPGDHQKRMLLLSSVADLRGGPRGEDRRL